MIDLKINYKYICISYKTLRLQCQVDYIQFEVDVKGWQNYQPLICFSV